MEVKPGYKLTEVGVIPEDWNLTPFVSIGRVIDGDRGTNYPGGEDFSSDGHCLFLNAGNVTKAGFRFNECAFISHEKDKHLNNGKLKRGDIVLTTRGTVGNFAHFDPAVLFDHIRINSGMVILRTEASALNASFLYALLQSHFVERQIERLTFGSAQPQLTVRGINEFAIIVPLIVEQHAIATALNDADALIESLEQLLAKKRNLKQSAMQELLTGKRRLPGYANDSQRKGTELGYIPQDWNVHKVGAISECLDNQRIPLNSNERSQRRGDIPYCGANGILDYIDAHLIDDDIILMAEDGGYFDEYTSRPIAYRMKGKCWVNNHAHILRARKGFDQGFLFYSLVHKNILRYLASGTRAKLNRSEMDKIDIAIPPSEEEQIAISTILVDIDSEITECEQKLAKARQIKQGMMQELLTGRIRVL